MSRRSIAEYIAEKRRAYATAGSAKRTRILDEVCETVGYTRKYVIKLMTGNIRYKEASTLPISSSPTPTSTMWERFGRCTRSIRRP